MKKASLAERPLVETLMQTYLRDISEFDSSVPGSDGRFEVGNYFPLYWTEPDRYPYLCVHRDGVVGFALVRHIEARTFSVDEFFVLPDHRAKGLGKQFACKLFDLHRGTWRVAQVEANLPAQKFWRSVINDYSNGSYSEEWSESSPRGPVQIFTVPDR